MKKAKGYTDQIEVEVVFENLSFGAALEIMREGIAVTRKAWVPLANNYPEVKLDGEKFTIDYKVTKAKWMPRMEDLLVRDWCVKVK